MPLATFLTNDGSGYSFRDTTMSFGGKIGYRLHYFQHGEFTIWGLTANILIEAATVALGRQPGLNIPVKI